MFFSFFFFFLLIFSNVPFASPPPGDVQSCQSIPAGPIVPHSTDLSNGIGGVPFQRVRSHGPAEHALEPHIPPHRLWRLAEAVGVPWDLAEVEPGGIFQDGGEEFIRKGVDCRWHGLALFIQNDHVLGFSSLDRCFVICLLARFRVPGCAFAACFFFLSRRDSKGGKR